MGSRLYPAAILILHCLLLLLVKVDSRGNQNHSQMDRQRHLRAHNLHRPPYEGYDWHKHFNRDAEPKAAVAKEKKESTFKHRSGHFKKMEQKARDISNWSRARSAYQKETAELEKWGQAKNITDNELKAFFDGEISTKDKYRLFGEIQTVVQILKEVKQKGAVTEKERAMITPDLIPLILRFGRMFEREFAKNTNASQALQILVNEVQKSKSRKMGHKSSRRYYR
ncbi:uncharacterized protein LOC6614753 isoform X1 [Drosophila sechellia]|uniref:GM16978 n=1 Tax=Drosophila sechellia TaxID=7238 RepID=B4I612_DROSE|nr:uncharacterized protein LOC6614753 isoform X1 [Drosophila sechellia]EDW55818.1 GM16978 [Drosophila sechellia]